MQRVTVRKLSSRTPQHERRDNGVGEDLYEGVMVLEPARGHSFSFINSKDSHMIVTSRVRVIEEVAQGKVILHTENSLYEVTFGERRGP